MIPMFSGFHLDMGGSLSICEYLFEMRKRVAIFVFTFDFLFVETGFLVYLVSACYLVLIQSSK